MISKELMLFTFPKLLFKRNLLHLNCKNQYRFSNFKHQNKLDIENHYTCKPVTRTLYRRLKQSNEEYLRVSEFFMGENVILQPQ